MLCPIAATTLATLAPWCSSRPQRWSPPGGNQFSGRMKKVKFETSGRCFAIPMTLYDVSKRKPQIPSILHEDSKSRDPRNLSRIRHASRILLCQSVSIDVSTEDRAVQMKPSQLGAAAQTGPQVPRALALNTTLMLSAGFGSLADLVLGK